VERQREKDAACAAKIQAIVRGKSARSHHTSQLVNSLEDKRVAHRERVQEDAAAAAAMRAQKLQEVSVVSVQKVFRGHITRVSTKEKVAEKNAALDAAAATSVQKMYRGHQARDNFQIQKQAAVEGRGAQKIQSAYRGKATRSRLQNERALQVKQEKAATQLQAVARGSSGRALALKHKHEREKAEADEHERRRTERQAAECIQSVARGKSARRRSLDLQRQKLEEEQKLEEHMARAAGDREYLQRWILKWSPELRLLYIFFVDLSKPDVGRGEIDSEMRPLARCKNTVNGLKHMLQEECNSIKNKHIKVWWASNLVGKSAEKECVVGDQNLVLAGLVNVPSELEVHYDSSGDGSTFFHELGTAQFDMAEVLMLSNLKAPSNQNLLTKARELGGLLDDFTGILCRHRYK